MDNYSEIKRYKMILESFQTNTTVPEDMDMEEGNEFSGARAAAIKAGKDTFTVDGETYHVTGDKEVDETESADWNALAMEASSDIDSQWENAESVTETDTDEQNHAVETNHDLQRLRELSGLNF